MIRKVTLDSITGQESLSEPFSYSISAHSKDNALDFKSIVGKDVSVAIQLPDGKSDRYINGVVTRFTMSLSTVEATHYTLELRPWLWLMSMQADCAVFQNMSVPDIVKKVCNDAGYTDISDKLTGSYDPREYTVQYNETAFAFVSRLMEEEGIFYFFTHTANAHTMVLADSAETFADCEQADSLTFHAKNVSNIPAKQITDVSLSQRSITGKYGTGDYNFETPDTDLTSTAAGENSRMIYEYPAGYTVKSTGETIAGRRLDGLEANEKVLSASSPASGLCAGGIFTVTKHDRRDINAKWAVTALSISASTEYCRYGVTAIPAETKYRPVSSFPKPRVPGPLTAVVTGKAGEEIWTDKYGRIKVHFFWDRQGKKDENSSCWVRVAQPWAGKAYGALFLPRIGHEVVVSFINGDPDKPLVTGAVYNANQTVPYTLPDNATRTVIKTNSSKDAQGSNELRFEDKAGEEEVFIHAQKDMNTTIENERTTTIKKADDTLTLEKGNRSLDIQKGTETHHVKGTRSVTVEDAETRTNKADYTATVDGDYNLTVKGAMTLKVTGDITISSDGNVTIKAG
uniref:type VI secretion system Vgr family protein n=1 Tax=Maridesulfovibrio zosterae TaxID=82171 RepID=UPI0012EC0337